MQRWRAALEGRRVSASRSNADGATEVPLVSCCLAHSHDRHRLLCGGRGVGKRDSTRLLDCGLARFAFSLKPAPGRGAYGILTVAMSDTIRLFADAWKVITGRLPSARIEEADGVVSCFGNVPLLFLNIFIIDRHSESQLELRALLKIAAERALTCKHPSGVLLREDWLSAGWEDVIKEAGLAPIVPMTGMEGDELLPPRRAPAKLEVRRVTDDAMARDLAELNAHAYHMPAGAFDSIANIGFWYKDSYAYVGYVDGKPVSCASALPVAGTVYIAFVATLPEAQGKGYAESLMRHAVTEGQRAMGTKRTTLHASDMGLPVYRAMGYRPGARLILVSAANPDSH